MTALKFNVDGERQNGHLVLNWSHPICGFGQIVICEESGITNGEGIGVGLISKIFSDWITDCITPYVQHEQIKQKAICRVETEYLSDRIVITYVICDDNRDYTRNKICIVSSENDGTTIYNGIIKSKVNNVYAGKRLVREYLTSSGYEVLDR